MIRRLPATVALVSALAALPAGAEPSFLIVTPSGPGNQSQAQGFLGELAAALAETWPAGRSAPALRGYYHVAEADARGSMSAHPPVFVLASPGFYLRSRSRFEVLLAPVRAGAGDPVFRLVTAAPEPQRVLASGSAAGLRVGGLPAGEADWTRNVLLAGLSGTDKATLVPVGRALETVRRLRSGELDVALLHDTEWRRLGTSGKAEGLAVARSTGPVPEGPVVFVKDLAGDAAARRLVAADAAKALEALQATAAGRAVLGRMALQGFTPARDADYDEAARLFAGASPGRSDARTTP